MYKIKKNYINIGNASDYFQDKVREALGKVCKKLPESIANQCTQFIDLYGDAVVAILAQEIDPSQVSVKIYLHLYELSNKCNEL